MIKKIRVEDLEVGMFVEDFNVPWMDHPFMTSKKKIRSAKEIDLVKEHKIEAVFINTDRGKDSPRAVAASEAEAEVRHAFQKEVGTPSELDPSAEVRAGSFRAELRQAEAVYCEAKTLVHDLLHDARMGKSIDGERAARTVDAMVDSIFRNPDALTSLSRLKSFDDYTFQHSINVSVLALALGRHLGILKDELRRLGVGAILHDIGKMRVPEAILNKPGRYTDEEFEVMKAHPLHGAKILMDTPDVPDESAAVALNHHERFNGRGYPRGLKGMAIGKFGLISAVVDVYDAITSDRVYHKGMASHQAMQKMFEWGKTDFYPVYIHKFIQCMGIYPVGTLVLLDTREVGVVVRPNHTELLRPVVRLVRGADGAPTGETGEIDLGEADPTGAKPFCRTVEGTLDPSEEGIDVNAVLGLGEKAAA